MAKTQITTGRVRFSYVNAFHPRADQNGVEKIQRYAFDP